MVGWLLRVSKITGVEEVKGQEPSQELTPTIEPKKQGIKPDENNYKAIVAKYFPDCPELAWQVVKKESGGNPNAHNFSHRTKDDSWGLFQINRYGYLKTRPEPDKLVNAEFNIKYARGMYEASGYTFKFHWKTTSNKLGL